MLGVIFWSFIGALICMVIIVGIGFVKNRKNMDESKINTRINWAIAIFIFEFFALLIIFYVSCSPQTLVTVIKWTWVPLIFIWVFNIAFSRKEECDTEWIVTLIIAIISGTVCIVSLFVPVQNLIYVRDMEDVDVTYAVSSDEVLAKVELKIDNSKFAENYAIESPEMRHVEGKDIALYHIKAKSGNTTEYIPGYAIQEENELPKIISKRIYFDTSYENKRDALRTVRRKYPTVILGDHKFDIDDNWNPYEIYEYRENLFYTNGKDYGIIILNLMDGTCEKYPAAENKIPAWVDFETTYPR